MTSPLVGVLLFNYSSLSDLKMEEDLTTNQGRETSSHSSHLYHVKRVTRFVKKIKAQMLVAFTSKKLGHEVLSQI